MYVRAACHRCLSAHERQGERREIVAALLALCSSSFFSTPLSVSPTRVSTVRGPTTRKLRRSRASLRFFPFLSTFLFSSSSSSSSSLFSTLRVSLLSFYLFFFSFCSPLLSFLSVGIARVSLYTFTDEIPCIFYTHVYTPIKPLSPMHIYVCLARCENCY